AVFAVGDETFPFAAEDREAEGVLEDFDREELSGGASREADGQPLAAKRAADAKDVDDGQRRFFVGPFQPLVLAERKRHLRRSRRDLRENERRDEEHGEGPTLHDGPPTGELRPTISAGVPGR